MVWRDKVYTYRDILGYVEGDLAKLREHVASPLVVSVEADFSPHAAALLLALIELGCVVVPLTESVAHQKDEFKEIAEVEASVRLNDDDSFDFSKENRPASHELLSQLKQERHPGLILFSSGSTGKSKAAVHDFLPLLEKSKMHL